MTPPPAPEESLAPRPAARRRPPPGRARQHRPPAPWDPFPLVELCVLLAIVLGIVGFVTWGPRGQVMVGAAAVLGSLGGLELAIREHFAGFRSHTLLLSGTVAVAVLGALYFARAPYGVMLACAAAVFATAFFAFRGLFRRRSGGFGFR